ncbi:MAG TPA: hypothetical protein VOA41_13765 [Candidatus Dormibacteraeota bacterium]|nr:hypothetical protein [Candidatus Dormibacteraeota bacterium]
MGPADVGPANVLADRSILTSGRIAAQGRLLLAIARIVPTLRFTVFGAARLIVGDVIIIDVAQRIVSK